MACETAWDVLCSVVGAGKFWGCEGFLPEFPQTCPKKIWATFCANIFSQADLILEWSPKKGRHVILQKLGAIFFKSNQVWRHFYPDFQGFCKRLYRFPWILPGILPILPNQNFWGCAWTPASYSTDVGISWPHKNTSLAGWQPADILEREEKWL